MRDAASSNTIVSLQDFVKPSAPNNAVTRSRTLRSLDDVTCNVHQRDLREQQTMTIAILKNLENLKTEILFPKKRTFTMTVVKIFYILFFGVCNNLSNTRDITSKAYMT